tara:strand:+ start:783 stop:1655 length:873 start_codon:yes stop_codon:yes gene_type:complete
MGGMCQPVQTDTVSSTSVLADTQIPEWVSQGGQELFGQASHLAQQPFAPYGGARVADFTADELTGFGNTRSMAADATGRYGTGLDMINAAGGTFDATAAEKYMSPYASNVTDIATRELNREFDLQRANENARAASNSAFGGTRNALLEAENERSRNLALSDLVYRGQADAYKNAQNMFNQDLGRGLQAGQVLTGQGTQGNQALMAAGGLARSLDQTGLETGYKDYLEQREYPYQQANFAIGALKGLPYEKSTQTDTITQAPQLTGSPLSQTAGALAGMFGAYNLFGNRPA